MPKRPNPTDGWLTDKQWANMIDLSDSIAAFKGLDQDIEYNTEKWKHIHHSEEPWNIEEAQWPEQWVKQLNSF